MNHTTSAQRTNKRYEKIWETYKQQELRSEYESTYLAYCSKDSVIMSFEQWLKTRRNKPV